MSTRVTIQDIADALGISRNTVSKAINNSDGIAAATRDKVLAKAAEMGYRQFSYVQALSSSWRGPQEAEPLPGSSGEIALLTTMQFNESHFAVTMIDRLGRELAQFGYSLVTYFVNKDLLEQKQLPYPLPRENTKAFICFEMFDWSYCDMLCALDMPLLFVDGPSRKNGRKLQADQLCMDSISETTKVILQAVRMGKKRFGFVGDPAHCQSFFERFIALYSSLVSSGIPYHAEYLVPENHPIDVYHGIESMPELPEFFLCANDDIAIDVIRILKKLGKSVPEDVMVCGFDDTTESRQVEPSLTTVHIHTQVMAYTAAQLLLTRIQDPFMDFRTVYTQTDLVLRDSTRNGKEAGAE